MTNALSPTLVDPALLSSPAKPSVPRGLNMEKIDETARDFEAMFLSEMLKPMFDTIEVDENFGGGRGEEVFRSFLRDEYGKILAGSGTVGIAEQVREELIRMQSKAGENGLAQNLHGISG